MTHELKIPPKNYRDVRWGDKSFELGKNDRDYKIGDTIILREWDGTNYTNSPPIQKFIAYILTSEEVGFGMEDGYCILGLE
jgi:hypothetical protein